MCSYRVRTIAKVGKTKKDTRYKDNKNILAFTVCEYYRKDS